MRSQELGHTLTFFPTSSSSRGKYIFYYFQADFGLGHVGWDMLSRAPRPRGQYIFSFIDVADVVVVVVVVVFVVVVVVLSA